MPKTKFQSIVFTAIMVFCMTVSTVDTVSSSVLSGSFMSAGVLCRTICQISISNDFSKITFFTDFLNTLQADTPQECTHAQCAKQMEISHTTVTEIYETARYKLADSVVNCEWKRWCW